MASITLELSAHQVLWQVGTFHLVQELRNRLKNRNYISKDLLDELEQLEDAYRDSYSDESNSFDYV
jgi:hypothetical protein